VRAIFGDRPNFAVVMGDVEEIDLAGKRVRHSRGEVMYDYLVLAAGGVTRTDSRGAVAQAASRAARPAVTRKRGVMNRSVVGARQWAESVWGGDVGAASYRVL
jgi:NADH dehydrogenase FAD-containing subunit